MILSSQAAKDTTQQLHMLEAARAGQESVVARLLSLNPSLVNTRTRDWSHETPLHLAATNGHDGVAAQLLASSPRSSDARNSEGRTALHLAARNGHDKIVERLLAHNPALIDAVTAGDEMTVLHFAACGGHESTMTQLLNHRPGLIDLKTVHDQTALHFAASIGHVKVVAQLLALSPQSSGARELSGQTALHLAAGNGHDEIVARLLVYNPALIDAVTSDDKKMTALHFAACGGHEVIVMQLLNHSPGLIDMKTADNADTALHLAAFGGHVKVVAELLARRPSSLAWEDWEGRTPLFCAASEGYQEVVDLFPLTTDQVHHRDSTGNTLLHLVVIASSLKPAFIQRVWEMNPDALFVANAHGNTPFDFAIGSLNEWSMEQFQWKLSIWSVEEALAKEMRRRSSQDFQDITSEVEELQRREQRFREVVQGECERPLLLSLPRDCVRLISDYLFISVFISRQSFGGWRGASKSVKAE